MILYKYMSLFGAKKVIETSSIGFSHLEDFNDPFECTSFGFRTQPESFVTPSMALNACKNRFSRNYVVLSLTRQPLNALMWSHYGDSHKGVVIGIDVNEANLDSISNNFIPYQFGEVIYTSTKPYENLDIIDDKELMSIGETIVFNNDMFNLSKKAFLYKSLEWAYEEEVRVVKGVRHLVASYHSSEGQYGEFNIIRLEGRPLWCFSIPKDSIKEIYIGKNVYKNVSRTATISQDELNDLFDSWVEKGIDVYHCDSDLNTWGLKKRLRDKQKSD